MNILGIRELTIDRIIEENNLDNVIYGGGGTAHNVIWNLLNTSNNLYIGGVYGDSPLSLKEIDILNENGINTEFLDKRNKAVRSVLTEIKPGLETKNHIKCLKCGKDIWSSSAKYKFNKDLLDEHKINIIVFDAYKIENNEIAKSAKEKGIINVLDWGTIGNLRYFSEEKMKQLSENPYDIIQMNRRTSAFFIKRLDLKSNKELFEFLNVAFLILTNEDKGTTIMTSGEEKHINFKVEEVLDNNGAGDAILSSFITAYIKTKYNINKNFNDFIKVFINISEIKILEVLKTKGARVNYPYFKYKLEDDLKDDHCSLCFSAKTIGKNKIKKKKKFKIETSVGQITKRLENGITEASIEKTRQFIERASEDKEILILGQGASYVAAAYVSKIINDNTDILSFTMYLDEIYESPFLNKIKNILILSNSGTSPDVKKSN